MNSWVDRTNNRVRGGGSRDARIETIGKFRGKGNSWLALEAELRRE